MTPAGADEIVDRAFVEEMDVVEGGLARVVDPEHADKSWGHQLKNDMQ